jgi:hypothetical protein
MEFPVFEVQEKPSSIMPEPQPQNPIEIVPLESEKGIDYRKLRDLLKSEKWEEADQATGKVMMEIAGQTDRGYLTPEDLKKFPCPDLQIIDALWIQSSGGHFGFSVQKKIWEECGAITNNNLADWKGFGDRVGWRQQGEWKLTYSDLQKNLELSPVGEFPLCALFGSLDWRYALFSRRDLWSAVCKRPKDF